MIAFVISIITDKLHTYISALFKCKTFPKICYPDYLEVNSRSMDCSICIIIMISLMLRM